MELPLFPLHLVLFPGRPLPLHVFESRYRRLLNDCLGADRRFGVVAIRAGQETGEPAEIYEVGTVAEIQTVTPLPEGRSDINTRGVQRFRVHGFVDGAPYLTGEVELLEDDPPCPDDWQHAQQLRELLAPYLERLGAPEEIVERLPGHPNDLAYLAAAAIQAEVPQQQQLLELTTSERLQATVAMMRRETGFIRHFGSVGSLRPPGPNGADLN